MNTEATMARRTGPREDRVKDAAPVIAEIRNKLEEVRPELPAATGAHFLDDKRGPVAFSFVWATRWEADAAPEQNGIRSFHFASASRRWFSARLRRPFFALACALPFAGFSVAPSLGNLCTSGSAAAVGLREGEFVGLGWPGWGLWGVWP